MSSRHGWGVAVVTALAVGLLTVAGPTGVARADGESSVGWIKATTQEGCYLNWYTSVGGWLQSDPPAFLWTGPCTAGQPIDGEGVFYVEWSSGQVFGFRGRVRNGMMDGPFDLSEHRTSAGQRLDPSRADRTWSQSFQMGCSESDIALNTGCSPGGVSSTVSVRQVAPYFPLVGGPSSFAGSPSATTTVPAAATGQTADDDCVSMDDKGTADHGWRVVNRCSYTAYGSWCYDDDGIHSCAKRRKGGFGPIGPGKSEAVAASPGGAGKYRITWCDYEHWLKGRCAPDKPWDGPPS